MARRLLLKDLSFAFLLLLPIISLSQASSDGVSVELKKSTLNYVAASNVSLSPTVRIQQSVGQSGIVGLSESSRNSVQQGYLNNYLVFSIDNTKNEFEETLELTLFPNPFQDHVNILFSKTTDYPVLVRVFDVRGRLVFDNQYQPSKYIRVPLEHLQEAGYIIRVASGGIAFLDKLIKFNN